MTYIYVYMCVCTCIYIYTYNPVWILPDFSIDFNKTSTYLGPNHKS